MKIEKRHIKHIVGWTVLMFCFVGMLIAGKQTRKHIKCTELEVVITDSLNNKFVDKDDIKIILDSLYGKYVGMSIDSLNLNRMEEIIDSNSAVKKSQVNISRDGILQVEIQQRMPIIRFITKDGGYYADEQGRIIPLQKNFSARVYVVDGHIPLPSTVEEVLKVENLKENKWFMGIVALADFMRNSEKWKDKFVQIHCHENGELTLIPRKGNESFKFGHPDRIIEKFERIALYYTTIIPEKGEKFYKTVDVAYSGQIICKK